MDPSETAFRCITAREEAGSKGVKRNRFVGPVMATIERDSEKVVFLTELGTAGVGETGHNER
jgi:hypothetical protein